MTIATLDQGIESRFVPQRGIRQATSLAGETTTVDDYKGRETGIFQLVYRAVSESAKDGFFTEYDTNYLSEFTFTFDMDSTTHTVIYARQPIATFRQDANAWDVEVRLAKIPVFGPRALESGDIRLLENDDQRLLEAN